MNNQVKNINQPIYSVLAHVYDTLMSDVDYEAWADYIDEVIQIHAPEAAELLELACGTGSVAIYLDELGYYSITATDASSEMIQMAKKKAGEKESNVEFRTRNFLDLELEKKYDLVFLVFDSINYLHTEQEILKLHEEVGKVLKPGGYFIFDFTTPRNSRQAIRYLHNEEGTSPDNYRFFRTSSFDAINNIHTNEFEIEKLNGDHSMVQETFVEVHKQKIYTYEQMLQILNKTEFKIIEAYDGFRFKKANKKSLRVTIVSQWQTTQ
jgi:ubiquinone/menaquinone biosynthesis C-methylase UbiE